MIKIDKWKLIAAAQKNGLSLNALCNQAGVSAGSLSQAFLYRDGIVKEITLVKLANELGVRPETLIAKDANNVREKSPQWRESSHGMHVVEPNFDIIRRKMDELHIVGRKELERKAKLSENNLGRMFRFGARVTQKTADAIAKALDEDVHVLFRGYVDDQVPDKTGQTPLAKVDPEPAKSENAIASPDPTDKALRGVNFAQGTLILQELKLQTQLLERLVKEWEGK